MNIGLRSVLSLRWGLKSCGSLENNPRTDPSCPTCLALSALYRDGGSKCRGVAESYEEGAEQVSQVDLL